MQNRFPRYIHGLQEFLRLIEQPQRSPPDGRCCNECRQTLLHTAVQYQHTYNTVKNGIQIDAKRAFNSLRTPCQCSWLYIGFCVRLQCTAGNPSENRLWVCETDSASLCVVLFYKTEGRKGGKTRAHRLVFDTQQLCGWD